MTTERAKFVFHFHEDKQSPGVSPGVLPYWKGSLSLLRDYLLTDKREKATAKIKRPGNKLTGKTLTMTVEPASVPQDQNWLGSQQRLHLIDDLIVDALRYRDLRGRADGWFPPRNAELAELNRLEKRFGFEITDG